MRPQGSNIRNIYKHAIGLQNRWLDFGERFCATLKLAHRAFGLANAPLPPERWSNRSMAALEPRRNAARHRHQAMRGGGL